MTAPIVNKKALVGVTFAMGIAMWVNAGPTIASDIQRSPFDQTNVVTTPLSPVEKTRAEAWGLSDAEWQRYQTLMDGIRGSISPDTLSPIEVLGIHARDEDERRRYAERWARLMRDDAERILAFQHAYDRAWQRLFPSDRPIDPARLPDGETADVTLQPTDRVLFFTRPDCASCDVLLQRLLKRIDTLAGVDIYLLGLPPDDDTAARDWAERQAIAPRWVRSRQTLGGQGPQSSPCALELIQLGDQREDFAGDLEGIGIQAHTKKIPIITHKGKAKQKYPENYPDISIVPGLLIIQDI